MGKGGTAGPTGPPETTLAGLGRAFRKAEISPVEATREMLDRIEAAGELNAFVTVTGERALAEAERAEKEMRSGRDLGPLHGVPIALKDIIYTRDTRTTMGSEFFENYVPDHSATVTERLEAAGAVLVGKTSTHEFAYGPTGDASRFGASRNPRDPEKITGGSSGGSGAAVAAGLCCGALGTDTGGSIRIPAALCGVVGMKPTFGRVSKHGVFPLSWTLDHVGPMTRTVEDNALLLNAIAGHDPRDLYSAGCPAEDFARDLHRGVRGGVIGVPAGFYFEHIEEEVEARVRAAVERFRGLGAEVREVEVAGLHETLAAQRLVLAAEAYAVHEERLKSAPEKFGDEEYERLMGGEPLRAFEYVNARQTRLRALRESERVLSVVDVLLVPSVPIAATGVGQREVSIGGHEERVRSALTRLTGPTNLTGLPSLSVPCGATAEGLPVGLQLIGRPFDEATLYRYGYAFEEGAVQE